MNYSTVYNLIKTALTGRTTGTKVQVEAHEGAELALLTYIEQVKSYLIISEAHGSATAAANLTLTWSVPFSDQNYSFTVQAFDGLGNPVECYLISKSPSSIVIKTLVNASVMAFARPYTISMFLTM